VADPVPGEQFAQRAVLDVAEAVVGHQPLRDDPVLGEEGERAFDEGGHRRRALVVVELDVGEPRVVVDDRVPVVGSVTVRNCSTTFPSTTTVSSPKGVVRTAPLS